MPSVLDRPLVKWLRYPQQMRKALRAVWIAWLITLAGAGVAAAANMTLAWDPSDGSAGYIVSYGTQPGVYTTNIDVGNKTAHEISGFAEGRTYYFAVRAYFTPSNPSEFSEEVSGTPRLGAWSVKSTRGGPDSVITGDFDGDHLDDVFLYDRNGTGAFSIGLSTGVGTFTAGPAGGWATGWNVTRADFDGNGLADLFLHNPLTGTWVKVINGGGGVFSYFAGGWLTEFTPYVTDLNGDGKSDVFLYGPATGRWLKCLSVGDGRVGFTYLSGGWRAGWNLQLADWNGDGLADFFLIDSTGLWFKATNDGAAGSLTPLTPQLP